jgi:ankyrin repeat protein
LELRRELDEGLNPNLKNRFGWTLLMVTALEGTMDVLDLLIARGADPRLKNKFGNTAESLARFEKHSRAADFIARHAAKKNMVLNKSVGTVNPFSRATASIRRWLNFLR